MKQYGTAKNNRNLIRKHELKERQTSGLQNKMRPLANCSSEKECRNSGNSAKHKGVHQKARKF